MPLGEINNLVRWYNCDVGGIIYDVYKRKSRHYLSWLSIIKFPSVFIHKMM